MKRGTNNALSANLDVLGGENGSKSAVLVLCKATGQAPLTLFGRSQKGNSPNFAITEFWEVRLREGWAVAQEGGIGVARLNESPDSEARMIAECADCTRLSSEGIHSSIASSMAAVLITRWLASTSAVNRSCCSRAVSNSTGLTQLKEAQTVLPSPRSPMSRSSWS